MSDEPKLPSAKLEALRADFNRAALEAKEKVAALDKLIVEAKATERRQALDQTLDLFVHDYAALKGHDVTFLVAKSKGMGEGAASPIGAALDLAAKVFEAVETHDVNVAAAVWDKGSKWLRLKDGDSIEKAREKAGGDAKEFGPVAKEIMLSNTPDRAGERQKHFIVITDGSVTDDPAYAAQMITTALQFNPKLSFDFISFGDGSGNIKDLAAQIKAPAQNVSVQTVEKPESLQGAVMSLLTGRFAKEEAPKPAPAVAAPKTPSAP